MNAVERPSLKSPASAASVEAPTASVWLRLLDRPWRSLVAVCASERLNVEAFAEAFAQIGGATRPDEHHRVVDLRGAQLSSVPALRAELLTLVERRERVLILVDPPSRDAVAVGVAQAADAAIVVVGLGRTTVEEAKDAAEATDKAKLLGSVALLE